MARSRGSDLRHPVYRRRSLPGERLIYVAGATEYPGQNSAG